MAKKGIEETRESKSTTHITHDSPERYSQYKLSRGSLMTHAARSKSVYLIHSDSDARDTSLYTV